MSDTCQPILMPFPSGKAWAHSRACRVYPLQKISAQAPWHDGDPEGGEDVAGPALQGEGTKRANAVTRPSEVNARPATSSRLAAVSRLTRRHQIESRRTGLDEAIRRHPSNATLTPIGELCPAHPHYLWWECPTCSDRETG